MTTMINDVLRQMLRAMDDDASEPEAFTLLLRLLVTHFDRVDTGEGYTKLRTFGVGNGTFCFQFQPGVPHVSIGSHGE